MKIIVVIFIFLLSSVLTSLAQLSPVETILPPVPNMEAHSGEGQPEILWMKCEGVYLNINFVLLLILGGESHPLSFTYYIDKSYLVQYDMKNIKYIDPVLRFDFQHGMYEHELWNEQRCDGLIHDASSVTVDNQKIFLENAYFHREDWIDEFPEREFLGKACVPNERYIVGVTHYLHDYYAHEMLRVWNSHTGKEYSDLRQILGLGYHEIYFSPQGNYVIARHFYDNELIYLGEEGYVQSPQSFLIDLSHPRKLTSNRDVAFTSDDEYFVTERDGVPTLVHARTDTNILRYAMESPMISAAFSPDNQRLYIAGANSQIYVFDSHLQSNSAGWDVYRV